MAIDGTALRPDTDWLETRAMSETQVEERLKAYLGNQNRAVAARELVNQLHNEKVSPSSAKMALLRLANRSEVRVTSDLMVELVPS